MGKIPLVPTLPSAGLCDRTSMLPFQIFPPRVIEAARRYRFDKKLGNDPVEYQRIYEELKVEAALVVIVGTSAPLARFQTLSLFR